MNRRVYKCYSQLVQQQMANILLSWQDLLYGADSSGKNFGTNILSVISCFSAFSFFRLSVSFTWVLLDCCVYVSAAECVVLSTTAMFKGTERQKYSFTARLKGKSPAFRDASICLSVLQPEVKVVHFCCTSSVWSVNQINSIFKVPVMMLFDDSKKRNWQSETGTRESPVAVQTPLTSGLFILLYFQSYQDFGLPVITGLGLILS